MIDNLLKLGKENDINIEVFTSKTKEVAIETLNDTLMNFNIDNSVGYNIKAIYNGKSVNISCESLDNPIEIIENIKKNAVIIDNTNSNRLAENDYNQDERKVRDIDFKQIKENLLSLNNLKEKYSFLVNINSIVDYGYFEKRIDNLDHHLNDSYDFFQIMVSVSGKKDNVIKSKYVSLYVKDFDFDKVLSEVNKEIVNLEREFDAVSVKTNKYKVILTNKVVNSLLVTMQDMFDSKSIYLKLSLLSNDLGKKIFSDKISIVEEPLKESFIVNRHFDFEGTLTYNKDIVKNGVFVTALNDLEYAIKTDSKPTGNASGTYNYHLVSGDKSYNELVKLMNNGIIINNVEGLHAGINHFTGDISLQAEGLLIENGKIKKALNTIILSTNIKELLNNVIAVGNDLREFSSTSSAVSLLCDNITIAGNQE